MIGNYEVGEEFDWHPFYKYEPSVRVTVVEIKKHGMARLSNGWVVDESGEAEGTKRQRGGRISEVAK